MNFDYKWDLKAELKGLLNDLPFIAFLLILVWAYDHDVVAYRTAWINCEKSIYGSAFNTNFTAILPSNVSSNLRNFTQPDLCSLICVTHPNSAKSRI